jgi:hypothetical protein
MDVMQPAFQDEKAVNHFDFWEGADFKLKIRQVEGYRNYDKSEFSSPAPLSTDDSKLEAIYGKMHSLQEFLDPKNYKTYAELQTKLQRVLGQVSESGAPSMQQERVMNEPAPAPTFKEPVSVTELDGDEDDTMSYFAKLAQDD